METQICRICKESKPITDFYENRRLATGIEPECKSCRTKHFLSVRTQRKQVGLCHCGQQPLPGRKTCPACRERHRRWKAVNGQYVVDYEAKRNAAMKKAVFDHYGNRCECCGETRPEFFTIDHLNNDGAKHRKEMGRGFKIHKWLLKHRFPDGFRLLCYNCNCSRGHYGYCPHERERSPITPS